MRIIDHKTDDRHYDAWLQLNVLSLAVCNLNCVYCFKNENGQREKPKESIWWLLKKLKLKLIPPKNQLSPSS